MLHELLLALAGHPGDVFKPYPETRPKTFVVPPDFPLHSAEKTSVQRLAHLGFLCQTLSEFCRSAPLSLAPLSDGISLLLQEYRQEVANLEQNVLLGNLMPLSSLVKHLSKVTLSLIYGP
jgi:hypothetical protein